MNDFFFEDKASIEKSLIVSDKLFFDTSPHVINIFIIVVNVENVPVFHEGSVFSEKSVLHILKIVLCHLIIHLILKSLKTSDEFTFPIHGFQFFEEIFFGFLPVLSSTQERKGHIFSRGSWIKDHHFDGWDISFQLTFDCEKN